MSLVILMLYLIICIIFTVTGVILRKGRSDYPDFRIGYHMKEAMLSKEKWEYANNLAGKLCFISALIFLAGALILFSLKASLTITLILFFVLSVTAISTIVFAPMIILKNNKNQL